MTKGKGKPWWFWTLAWAFLFLCISLAGKHAYDCRGDDRDECLGYTVILEPN